MKTAIRRKKLAKNAVVGIVSAKYVSGYKLKIHFSDGSARTIDFGPFLQSSTNPIIRAFLDPGRFAEFNVSNGDLMWGDFELCFPIADLYEDRI